MYKTRVEWDFIRRHLPPAAASVLDIGGGSGRFAMRLMRDGYDVTVNDRDAPSLRLLEERARAYTPVLVHGDFLQTPLPGPFDAAIAVECLENMPFNEVLRRVHAILRPEGIFVFTVLNRSSWRFALRRIVGRDEEGEYVERLSAYRKTWQQADFETLESRGFMWTLQTVTSNSPLVPVFTTLERVLRLNSFVRQSPWVLIALRRLS
jgi:SAM-dependent methyltransferase